MLNKTLATLFSAAGIDPAAELDATAFVSLVTTAQQLAVEPGAIELQLDPADVALLLSLDRDLYVYALETFTLTCTGNDLEVLGQRYTEFTGTVLQGMSGQGLQIHAMKLALYKYVSHPRFKTPRGAKRSAARHFGLQYRHVQQLLAEYHQEVARYIQARHARSAESPADVLPETSG
jgi:hypothetical protein